MQVPHVAAALLLTTPLALVWGASQTYHPPAEAPAQGTSQAQRYVYAGPWEYRVVGIAELHKKDLEYLRRALEEARDSEGVVDGLLGLARGADEQLAQKSEDLLNSLGAEGWELVQADARHMILKRPKPGIPDQK